MMLSLSVRVLRNPRLETDHFSQRGTIIRAGVIISY